MVFRGACKGFGMKLHLIFVGNKFISNTALKEYILREIEKKCDFISSIRYFRENDNSLFLYLEDELNSQNQTIIVTTKQNFSTIGKLICTVTSDNQIVKNNMLIPSKSYIFQEGSYLLNYKDALVNVLHTDEMQKLPKLLIDFKTSTTIHIFEREKKDIDRLLESVALMYDVNFFVIKIIDGWLKVEINSKKYGNISKFINAIKDLISQNLIIKSNIITHIIETLEKENKKITFAESCSGGLLSYYFTSQNGASKIFNGSLLTYSNELKENWLAVDENVIEEKGAVSYEVVEEMSEGAMGVSGADYAISISGIAGDMGGSEDKPVGTVYVGVRTKTNHEEKLLTLKGDRNYIQHQSVLFAIKMLLLIDKDVFFKI